jgi:hypothetical protein
MIRDPNARCVMHVQRALTHPRLEVHFKMLAQDVESGPSAPTEQTPSGIVFAPSACHCPHGPPHLNTYIKKALFNMSQQQLDAIPEFSWRCAAIYT